MGPLRGLTLRLHTDNNGSFGSPVNQPWATCRSDADGDCSFEVPSSGLDKRYWVARQDTPAGFSSLDQLVTGSNGGRLTVSPYRFRTPTVRANRTYLSGRDFMIGTGDQTANASSGLWQASRDNPAIPATCGLNVALVIDVSGSVGSDLPKLQQAAKTFTDSLVGTPSQVGLFTFAATAPANTTNNRNRPLTAVSSQAGADEVKGWIDGLTSSGATNWDRGIFQVAESPSKYDIAVVITDGNPTVYAAGEGPRSYTRFREIEEGIFSANAVKAEGTRVLAFGVGSGLGGNPQNLQSISGPTRDSDYFQTTDYGQAGAILRALAQGQCKGSVSVLKWEIPNTGTVTDAQLAGGWTFDATTSAPGVAVNPGSAVTDSATGAVNFELTIPGGVTAAPVQVVETPKPGFTLEPQNGFNGVCRRLDTDQRLPVANEPNGFEVIASPDYGISCDVYNRAPDPAAAVTVDKSWVVNEVAGGAVVKSTTYDDGDQPADLVAGLSVDGNDEAFGSRITGFSEGDQVALEETTDILLLQCALTGSRVTSANGQTVDEPIGPGTPYRPTLRAGDNDYTVTNTVDCETKLTLSKRVVGGNADPATWDLTAEGPAGALPGPTGADGSPGATGDVTPDERYILSESRGDPRYQQYRDPNATLTPPATGSWRCVEVDGQGGTEIPGFADGLNGGVRVPIGTWVDCEATNWTADLTLLKTVVNDSGGTAAPDAWRLTATPAGPPPAGLGPQTVTGSDQKSAANTIQVRPGQRYTLSETGPAGYKRTGIQCIVNAGTDSERVESGADLTLDGKDEAVCTFTNDDRTAELTVTKQPDVQFVDAAGDRITYTFTAENTGELALTDVSLADPMPGLPALQCGRTQPTSLAPGQSLSCLATYTATQADIDAGTIDNTATATGTPPERAPITGTAEARVPVTRAPKLTLDKSAKESEVTSVGQVVNYTFTATNIGNQTLTGVAVTDPLPGLSALQCGRDTTLAPGQALTCTATYATAQADLDAGGITNTATATGNPPTGPAVTFTDAETVPAAQTGNLELVKQASPTSVAAVGDVVDYTFTATNGGNVTLSKVSISDPLQGLSALQCKQPVTLAPGRTLTCAATYSVTQDDLNAGQIINTAAATGTRPGGAKVISNATARVTVAGQPGITLIKSASPGVVSKVGDVVFFSFQVTNSGNQDLLQVTMSDTRLPGGIPECVPIDLPRSDNYTCRAPYTVTQADIDNGEIRNVATATARAPGGGTVSDVSTAVVRATQESAVTLDKSSDVAGVAQSGDRVKYTFEVRNTGNTTLSDVTVTDPLTGLSALTCSATVPAVLAPKKSLTCTADYTVTQRDIDAGGIDNTATVRARGPNGEPTTDSATVVVPADDGPSLTLVKTPDRPVVTALGENVIYRFTATNTGNKTLSNVSITDPLPGLSALQCPQPVTLDPGQKLDCTADYSVTQSDLDTGSIANTATAVGTPPQSGPITTSDTVDLPALQKPQLAFSKTATRPDYSAVGDTITYLFAARNAGNVTLTGVDIDDTSLPGLSPLTCTPNRPATLAPNAVLRCSASYTVTQRDMDAGAVFNKSTATAQPPAGPPISGADIAIVPAKQSSALTLEKTADVPSVDTAGDTIAYTFTAANSGNTTLARVAISDPLPGLPPLRCDIPAPVTLPPGSVLTCNAVYTVTQADIDRGSVDNQASVQGLPPAAPPVTARDDLSVPVAQAPDLELTKTVDRPSFDTVPTDLAYTITAKNTGNVSLFDVGVDDPNLGPLTCTPNVPAVLAPDEVLTCTGTYTATQVDMDAGKVDNKATATATPPTGDQFTRTADVTVTAEQTDRLTLDKTADVKNVSKVGDRVVYTLVAQNAGTTSLSNVSIGDSLLGPPVALACSPAQPAILAPGEKLTCTGTYSTTQKNIDDAQIVNNGIATARTPSGASLRKEDRLRIPATQTAVIDLTKTADRTSVDASGQTITYTFRIAAGGNATLLVYLEDPLLTQAPTSCGTPQAPIVLTPGAPPRTCTATYTVTQADIDAGGVLNTARVTGTTLVGRQVTDEDTVLVPASQGAKLVLTKSADVAGVAKAGDPVDYTFEVRNTGNTTLRDVSVSDPLPGLSALTCFADAVTSGVPVTLPATLAPAGTIACTATYTTTQADVDAGGIDNTAAATGTPPFGKAVKDTDSETVPAAQSPGISLTKTPSPKVVSKAGEQVEYTFVATNSGNVTLSRVSVTDPLPNLSALSCVQPVTLAPGEVLTCTADYTVTQADVDAGRVKNTATVTGTPPAGPAVRDVGTATVTAAGAPAIDLTKAAIPDEVKRAGEQIGYTFVVSNTGNTTLTGVAVTDPLPGLSGLACVDAQNAAVTLPAALAPGAALTCTAGYTVTQADVDAGGIDNTGTAVGTPPSGPVVRDEASVRVPAAGVSKLILDKVADRPSVNAAGQVVGYTFTARNTGTMTLRDVSVSDPLPGLSALSCTQPVALAPGATLTCTATYTTTQADVDAGGVDNTATAVGSPDVGKKVTARDSQVVPAVQGSVIDLVKTPDRKIVSAVGEVVTYSFAATNRGNTTLTGVAVTDPLSGLSALSCTVAGAGVTQPVVLGPGGVLACTATYAVTQADLDAGRVKNTATVTGTPPAGPVVTDVGMATVVTEQSPDLTLAKSASPSQISGPGEVVTYTLTATNSGNTTLTDVSISDPTVVVVNCPPVDLAPGQSRSCTGTYTTGQADVDAGGVDNTATASGIPPEGPAVSASDTVRVPALVRSRIAVTKVADRPSVNAAGQVIGYEFVAGNTGNTTLRDVSVSDPLAGLSAVTCVDGANTPVTLPTILGPGAALTCTASYTTRQADIDAGGVDNTVTVSGAPPFGKRVRDTDSEFVPAAQGPKITLTKTPDPATVTAAGQVVTYRFRVVNDGNTGLSGVSVTDALPNLSALDCGTAPTDLAPGDALTCTASYTVTQADVDAGQVVNRATARGAGPDGREVKDSDNAQVSVGQAPALSLVKTPSPASVSGAGERIGYTFVATNTGNVTLTGVRITDPLPGLAPLSCTQPVDLAPGATLTCTATYTTTQTDIDTGAVENTATVTAKDPGGGDVTAVDTARVPASQQSKLVLTKSADKQSVGAGGEVIRYTFEARNAGNTTLTGVTIADPLPGLLPLDCPLPQPADLAPGATLTCTADYTTTQADIDAGGVSNTAASTGTPPSGKAVKDTDTQTVPATQGPSITLDKSTTATGFDAPGIAIPYTFTARNTGNVTLTDVEISDPLLGLSSLFCTPAQPASLPPGGTLSCTASYTTTQADVDAGGVSNVATVVGTAPTGATVTARDAVTVPGAQTPDIALVKTADTASVSAPGQRVTYTFVAENTGNTTLRAVTISDPLPGLSALTCTQPVQLRPGDTLTCTAGYTTTQADIDAGGITNTATTQGTTPAGTTVDDTATATVPAQRAARITLTKTPDRRTVSADGEKVTYTFIAANPGNVTLTGVTVDDPLPGLSALTCYADAVTSGVPVTLPATLVPAGTIACTADYTVTQKDMDAGSIRNAATATGTPPSGPDVTATAQATVTAAQTAKVTVSKTADVADVDSAGDRIRYSVEARNAGNVTLTDVRIDDPLPGLPALACTPAQPTDLAPGGTLRCTATYTMTQADIDAGGVVNRAAVTGSPPTGPKVKDSSTSVVPAVQQSRISLTKTANRDTLSSAGQTTDYTFTATNTSNVTLTDVRIDDPLAGLSPLDCTPAQPVTLAPGASLSCTARYAASQADLNAGGVTNTATAVGTTPPGASVTDDATVTVPVTRAPKITVAKTSDVTSVRQPGDRVTFRLEVTNTGNLTLTDVTATDPLLGAALTCDTPAPVTLDPGRTLACTGVYTTTQADVDSGGIDNTATATGTPPAGPAVKDRTELVVPAQSQSKLVLDKTADQTSVDAVGDVVTYTFAARNSGNVTLTGVSITDALPNLSALSCVQPARLAPGEVLTCTASYTVTQADIDAGGVANRATATGTPTVGTPVKDTAAATVPAVQGPAIDLVKSADLTEVEASGQVVAYTLTATNTGTVTLSAVAISDPRPGLSALACTQPATLAPGESLACTSTYPVTQADVDAGGIDNTGTVSASPASGPAVTDEATLTIPARRTARLDLVKRADPMAVSSIGQSVTYTFTATNGGNTTLTDVRIDDPLPGLSALDCAQPADLAPGEALRCTARYAVTETDLESGRITNAATATGTPPTGEDVTDTDEVVVLTQPTPGIAVRKSASPAGPVARGREVTYTYTVTNTGNMPVSEVDVSDDKCSPVFGPSGDTDGDGRLDTGETWVYTCGTALRETTTNTVVVTGRAVGQTVRATDTARVSVRVERTPCPITVVVKKPEPTKTGKRFLVKRITTSGKCKVVKPIVLCRPQGSSTLGEKAFCTAAVTGRGRIRVVATGYERVKVTVLVRAVPKPGRDRLTTVTWRRTWTLR